LKHGTATTTSLVLKSCLGAIMATCLFRTRYTSKYIWHERIGVPLEGCNVADRATMLASTDIVASQPISYRSAPPSFPPIFPAGPHPCESAPS
jgi:hypothetical protein